MPIKNVLKYKTSQAKAMPIILIVIAIIFAVIYFKTDLINQVIGDSQNQPVTYYQWTDERGEMIVSRNKPTSTDDYISFQSSENLIQSENNIDQDLIARSKNIQPNTPQQDQQKKSSGKGSISSVYPFNAMNKVRNCTNLSTQIADARNRGKDTSELKKRHAKECR